MFLNIKIIYFKTYLKNLYYIMKGKSFFTKKITQKTSLHCQGRITDFAK